jgi:hypothetical protein
MQNAVLWGVFPQPVKSRPFKNSNQSGLGAAEVAPFQNSHWSGLGKD